MTNLSITINGIEFRNPILVASGIAGYGTEWDGLCDFEKLGGVVLKGVSREPWAGNAPPRLAETPSGMLNAIGLENVGLDAFLDEKLPALEGLDTVIVANVVGRTVAEYADVCEALDKHDRPAALEVNVSCPNVESSGIAFGTNINTLTEVVSACRAATGKPLWVKLSPGVSDIAPFAATAVDAGADALTVANTIPAMAIDVESRRPVLGNTYGGLSGPAVFPVALRLVHVTAHAVDVPIIASGGAVGWRDAVAFMLTGASLVQMGTVLFSAPAAPEAAVTGLAEYAERTGFKEVSKLVGALINKG
ncbi:MAG: dihydroorotate dehydrogenase [Candidatus Coatesbacteria bacterium]|nr:MAG: dihydroorotate dehydrogenase [Candidatus Coatesbacteria bacterium]